LETNTKDNSQINTQRYRKTSKGVLTNLYSKMIERCRKNIKPLPNFTLKEFHNKFLNDENFLKIFHSWENSGYQYYYKPSIDRINPDKSYSKDNIQMLTWYANRTKGDRENAERFTTPIIMANRNNEFEMMFESVKQAVKFTGLSQGCIVLCCQGKRNYVGKHIFKYRGDKFRKHKNPELLEKSKRGE